MRKSLIPVIPSTARDLVFIATYEDEIPRLCLGMTVATQSRDEEAHENDSDELQAAPKPLSRRA